MVFKIKATKLTGIFPPPPQLLFHPLWSMKLKVPTALLPPSSLLNVEMIDVSEYDPSSDRPITLFNHQLYISQENRLVTVEYSALENNHVTFALATSITLLEDQKKLKAIKTADLESISFQCITAVNNLLFSQSFSPFIIFIIF